MTRGLTIRSSRRGQRPSMKAATESRRGRVRLLVLVAALDVAASTPSMLGGVVRAQTPAVRFDVRAAKGLSVSPVYEGWYEVDGRKYALFGYSNRNLEEVVDIPIGPSNSVTPGPVDHGQPTRFFPGLHKGVFALALPNDQSAKTVTWTLTANGQTTAIPVNLDSVYVVSALKETGTAYPGNTPPVLKFDTSGTSAQGPHGIVVARTAAVGRPLTLEVSVTDDGLPSGERGVTGKHQPLALRWQAYRGPGLIRFSSQRPPIEQGTSRTTVTFSEPGTYMLHLQAVDSMSINRCCWTNGYVAVTVAQDGERP